MSPLTRKRERYTSVVEEINAISDRATAAGRALTDQEHAKATDLFGQAKLLKAEIKQLEHQSSRKGMSDAIRALGAAVHNPNAPDVDPSMPTTLYAKAKSDTTAPLTLSEDQQLALFKAARDRGFKTERAGTEVPMAGDARYVVTPPLEYSRERTRILSLMPVRQVDTPTVWYYRATSPANAAAAVAEGAAKPESTPVWTRFEAPIIKVAHFAGITDEVLQDFGGFQQVMSQEMAGGLIEQESAQLLNGDGAAPNMTGLLTTAGLLTRAKGVETSVETIFLAIQDLRTGPSFTEADGIVLHPNDYGQMRLQKDSQNRYLAGDPLSSDPAKLWGVRVVLTTAIAEGTGVVANFAEATQVFLRQPLTIEVNPWGINDMWQKNVVAMRAEERLGLAVWRPKSIVKVTGI